MLAPLGLRPVVRRRLGQLRLRTDGVDLRDLLRRLLRFRRGVELLRLHQALPGEQAPPGPQQGLLSLLFHHRVHGAAHHILQRDGVGRGRQILPQLLQQVLQGEQAAGAAVLIHHQSHVDLPVLHIPEQYVSPYRLRHKIGRAEQLLQRLGLGFASIDQVVPGGQNAHDIVDIFLIYRKTGQTGGLDGVQNGLVVIIQRQGYHIGAVTHHVVGSHAVKFKDIGDELLFILLNGAGLLALFHHCHDLIGQFLTLISAQPGKHRTVEQ